MKLQKPLVLAVFAFAGALLTALLVSVALTGEPPVRQRTGTADRAPGEDRGAADEPERSGPRPGGRVTPEQARGEGMPRLVEGDREVRDSPEFQALVAQRGVRVLEILQRIRAAPEADASQRHMLYRELQTLMRQLGHRVDPAVREQLLSLLFTVEDRWRPLIGGALGQLRGDTETAQKLVARLQRADGDVFTRTAILTALGNMQVPEVVPTLLAKLGQGYESEPLIVRTLGNLGDSEVHLDLLGRLQGALRTETRREIVSVLGRSNDPAVTERIAQRLPEAGAAEQAALVEVLAQTRDPAWSEQVRDLMERGADPQVRQQAIRALGMFGDLESGRKLLDLVQFGDDQERIWATNAIHSMREAETLEALAGSWNELGERGRLAVVGAGKTLPRPGGALVEAALRGIEDSNRRIRTASAILLGHSRDERAVPKLVHLLRTATHMSERSTAVAQLLNIGTKEAAERGLESLDVIPNERQRESYARQFEKVLQRFAQRDQ